MFTGSALYNPLNVVLVLFYNQLGGSFSWNHMVNIYNSRCLYFVQDYMTIGGGLGWHLRPCVWMLWTEILGLQPYANSSTVLFHKRNSTCKGTKCSCKLVSFTRSHSLNSRWNLQCSAPLYPYFKDI